MESTFANCVRQSIDPASGSTRAPALCPIVFGEVHPLSRDYASVLHRFGKVKSYRTPFESCPCMRSVHCEPPLSKQAFRMQKHWAHTQLLSAHPRSQGGILFRLPTPKGDTLRLRVRVLSLKCCYSAPCLCNPPAKRSHCVSKSAFAR